MTREEAIKLLICEKVCVEDVDGNIGGERVRQAYDMAIETLSAEAVEVVRCKDCIRAMERDEYIGRLWCTRHREHMDDMYYCADGVRREDGKE